MTTTSQPQPAGSQDLAACRRPGCGQPLPPPGRGRTRQFCSDDCARRYHNDARIGVPAASGDQDTDPLAALEQALRQAAVLARTARDQAAALDPARVRAGIADTEAARRRAEAAAVTAQARQAEAEAEAQALAEALQAARDETRRTRDDAARERDALRESHNAQAEAQRALTDAERARAERAEAQLETERTDRRQLTSHITSNGSQDIPPPQRGGARSK
jgi:chromosome segregation ATPase